MKRTLFSEQPQPITGITLLTLSHSQSIHSPPFFSLRCPPALIYPFYLPPVFRRHFSSYSSPVAHPGVTRFSVASGGGRRGSGHRTEKKEHRGEELGQEAVDDTHAHVVAMVTGRLVGILWNEYLYVTRPMASSDI